MERRSCALPGRELLPGGRTAASLFKLNIKKQCKSSSLKRQHKDALADTDVFIWDEATCLANRGNDSPDMTRVEQPFGGKIFILGGDFRQVLPVVKRGSRGDAVEACIKSSPLWGDFTQLTLKKNMRVTSDDDDWTDFLLDVGNGTANDEHDRVELPREVMVDGNIVEKVFGTTVREVDAEALSERAILAPKNWDVDILNNDVLRIMEGGERKYYSADEAMCEDPADIDISPSVPDDSSNVPYGPVPPPDLSACSFFGCCRVRSTFGNC